jgi:hypothetical protein
MQQNSRLVLLTMDTFGAAAPMEEGREGAEDDERQQAEVSGEEVRGQQQQQQEEEEEVVVGAARAGETVDRAKCPLAVRTIHMAFLSAMVRSALPHTRRTVSDESMRGFHGRGGDQTVVFFCLAHEHKIFAKLAES